MSRFFNLLPVAMLVLLASGQALAKKSGSQVCSGAHGEETYFNNSPLPVIFQNSYTFGNKTFFMYTDPDGNDVMGKQLTLAKDASAVNCLILGPNESFQGDHSLYVFFDKGSDPFLHQPEMTMQLYATGPGEFKFKVAREVGAPCGFATLIPPSSQDAPNQVFVNITAPDDNDNCPNGGKSLVRIVQQA